MSINKEEYDRIFDYEDLFKKPSDILKCLARFDYLRTCIRGSSYKSLVTSDTGFFEPYNKKREFIHQLLTTFLTPLISLVGIIGDTIGLLISLLILLIMPMVARNKNDVACALYTIIGRIVSIIANPVVAIAVTISSLSAIFTRSIATIIKHNGDKFEAPKFLQLFLLEGSSSQAPSTDIQTP